MYIDLLQIQRSSFIKFLQNGINQVFDNINPIIIANRKYIFFSKYYLLKIPSQINFVSLDNQFQTEKKLPTSFFSSVMLNTRISNTIKAPIRLKKKKKNPLYHTKTNNLLTTSTFNPLYNDKIVFPHVVQKDKQLSILRYISRPVKSEFFRYTKKKIFQPRLDNAMFAKQWNETQPYIDLINQEASQNYLRLSLFPWYSFSWPSSKVLYRNDALPGLNFWTEQNSDPFFIYRKKERIPRTKTSTFKPNRVILKRVDGHVLSTTRLGLKSSFSRVLENLPSRSVHNFGEKVFPFDKSIQLSNVQAQSKFRSLPPREKQLRYFPQLALHWNETEKPSKIFLKENKQHILESNLISPKEYQFSFSHQKNKKAWTLSLRDSIRDLEHEIQNGYNHVAGRKNNSKHLFLNPFCFSYTIKTSGFAGSSLPVVFRDKKHLPGGKMNFIKIYYLNKPWFTSKTKLGRIIMALRKIELMCLILNPTAKVSDILRKKNTRGAAINQFTWNGNGKNYDLDVQKKYAEKRRKGDGLSPNSIKRKFKKETEFIRGIVNDNNFAAKDLIKTSLLTYSSEFYIPVQIIDQISKKMYLRWLLLADLPIQTKRGHFIINGYPKTVIHQIVRSPGIRFKNEDNQILADIISMRGAWMGIQIQYEKNLKAETFSTKRQKRLLAKTKVKENHVRNHTSLIPDGFLNTPLGNKEASYLSSKGGVQVLPKRLYSFSLFETMTKSLLQEKKSYNKKKKTVRCSSKKNHTLRSTRLKDFFNLRQAYLFSNGFKINTLLPKKGNAKKRAFLPILVSEERRPYTLFKSVRSAGTPSTKYGFSPERNQMAASKLSKVSSKISKGFPFLRIQSVLPAIQQVTVNGFKNSNKDHEKLLLNYNNFSYTPKQENQVDQEESKGWNMGKGLLKFPLNPIKESEKMNQTLFVHFFISPSRTDKGEKKKIKLSGFAFLNYLFDLPYFVYNNYVPSSIRSSLFPSLTSGWPKFSPKSKIKSRPFYFIHGAYSTQMFARKLPIAYINKLLPGRDWQLPPIRRRQLKYKKELLAPSYTFFPVSVFKRLNPETGKIKDTNRLLPEFFNSQDYKKPLDTRIPNHARLGILSDTKTSIMPIAGEATWKKDYWKRESSPLLTEDERQVFDFTEKRFYRNPSRGRYLASLVYILNTTNFRDILFERFMNAKFYDIGLMGRKRLNKKLRLNVPLECTTLTPLDFLAIFYKLFSLYNNFSLIQNYFPMNQPSLGEPLNSSSTWSFFNPGEVVSSGSMALRENQKKVLPFDSISSPGTNNVLKPRNDLINPSRGVASLDHLNQRHIRTCGEFLFLQFWRGILRFYQVLSQLSTRSNFIKSSYAGPGKTGRNFFSLSSVSLFSTPGGIDTWSSQPAMPYVRGRFINRHYKQIPNPTFARNSNFKCTPWSSNSTTIGKSFFFPLAKGIKSKKKKKHPSGGFGWSKFQSMVPITNSQIHLFKAWGYPNAISGSAERSTPSPAMGWYPTQKLTWNSQFQLWSMTPNLGSMYQPFATSDSLFQTLKTSKAGFLYSIATSLGSEWSRTAMGGWYPSNTRTDTVGIVISRNDINSIFPYTPYLEKNKASFNRKNWANKFFSCMDSPTGESIKNPYRPKFLTKLNTLLETKEIPTHKKLSTLSYVRFSNKKDLKSSFFNSIAIKKPNPASLFINPASLFIKVGSYSHKHLERRGDIQKMVSFIFNPSLPLYEITESKNGYFQADKKYNYKKYPSRVFASYELKKKGQKKIQTNFAKLQNSVLTHHQETAKFRLMFQSVSRNTLIGNESPTLTQLNSSKSLRFKKRPNVQNLEQTVAGISSLQYQISERRSRQILKTNNHNLAPGGVLQNSSPKNTDTIIKKLLYESKELRVFDPKDRMRNLETKLFNGVFKEFFNLDPLSQDLDETNGLSEIIHKRRISALGKGGVTSKNAPLSIRSIHPSFYGRLCPIDSPEGDRVGLINSLTNYARITSIGYIATPFYRTRHNDLRQEWTEVQEPLIKRRNRSMSTKSLATSMVQMRICPPIAFYGKVYNTYNPYPSIRTSFTNQSENYSFQISCFSQHGWLKQDESTFMGGLKRANNFNKKTLESTSQQCALPLLGLKWQGHGVGSRFVYTAYNTSQFNAEMNKKTGIEKKALFSSLRGEETKQIGFHERTHNYSKSYQGGLDTQNHVYEAWIRPRRWNPNPVLYINEKIKSNHQEKLSPRKVEVLKFYDTQYMTPPITHRENIINTRSLKSQKLPFRSFQNGTNSRLKANRLSQINQNTKPFITPFLTCYFDFTSFQGYAPITAFQFFSPGVGLIPFLEHDDGTRALMGANMQRQAVPLISSSRPIVGTGLEKNIAASFVISSSNSGYLYYISGKQSKQIFIRMPKTSNPRFERFNTGFVNNNEIIKNTPRDFLDPKLKKSLPSKRPYSLIDNNTLPLSYQRLALSDRTLYKGKGQIYKNFSRVKPNSFINLGHGQTFIKNNKNYYGLTYPKHSDQTYNLESIVAIKHRSYRENSGLSLFLDFYKNLCAADGKKNLFSGHCLYKKNIYNKNICAADGKKNIYNKNICAADGKKNLFSGHCLYKKNIGAAGRKNNHFIMNTHWLPYRKSYKATCINKKPAILENSWVQKGDLLVDGTSSIKGELSLGRNLFSIYMPWEGYNFEDAILISDRAAQAYTTIHVEEFSVKISKNEFVSSIIKPFTWVNQGEILVSKKRKLENEFIMNRLLFGMSSKPKITTNTESNDQSFRKSETHEQRSYPVYQSEFSSNVLLGNVSDTSFLSKNEIKPYKHDSPSQTSFSRTDNAFYYASLKNHVYTSDGLEFSLLQWPATEKTQDPMRCSSRKKDFVVKSIGSKELKKNHLKRIFQIFDFKKDGIDNLDQNKSQKLSIWPDRLKNNDFVTAKANKEFATSADRTLFSRVYGRIYSNTSIGIKALEKINQLFDNNAFIRFHFVKKQSVMKNSPTEQKFNSEKLQSRPFNEYERLDYETKRKQGPFFSPTGQEKNYEGPYLTKNEPITGYIPYQSPVSSFHSLETKMNTDSMDSLSLQSLDESYGAGKNKIFEIDTSYRTGESICGWVISVKPNHQNSSANSTFKHDNMSKASTGSETMISRSNSIEVISKLNNIVTPDKPRRIHLIFPPRGGIQKFKYREKLKVMSTPLGYKPLSLNRDIWDGNKKTLPQGFISTGYLPRTLRFSSMNQHVQQCALPLLGLKKMFFVFHPYLKSLLFSHWEKSLRPITYGSPQAVEQTNLKLGRGRRTNDTIYIYIAVAKPLQVGDKMSGRHGNKGIISKILPFYDMPYLVDGTPIDIVLNPLGVPSRMNVGQIYESLLGLTGFYKQEYYRIPPFDENYSSQFSRNFVYWKLNELNQLHRFGPPLQKDLKYLSLPILKPFRKEAPIKVNLNGLYRRSFIYTVGEGGVYKFAKAFSYRLINSSITGFSPCRQRFTYRGGKKRTNQPLKSYPWMETTKATIHNKLAAINWNSSLFNNFSSRQNGSKHPFLHPGNAVFRFYGGLSQCKINFAYFFLFQKERNWNKIHFTPGKMFFVPKNNRKTPGKNCKKKNNVPSRCSLIKAITYRKGSGDPSYKLKFISDPLFSSPFERKNKGKWLLNGFEERKTSPPGRGKNFGSSTDSDTSGLGEKMGYNPFFPGKMRLLSGLTGETFYRPIIVGKSYMLKLIHLVHHKIHARATGPYALITQQPLKGKRNQGGQRMGEMEIWALYGFGSASILYEMLTIKSDDPVGRERILREIAGLKGTISSSWKTNDNNSNTRSLQEYAPLLKSEAYGLRSNIKNDDPLEKGIAESFRVLVMNLRALCLDMQVFKDLSSFSNPT